MNRTQQRAFVQAELALDAMNISNVGLFSFQSRTRRFVGQRVAEAYYQGVRDGRQMASDDEPAIDVGCHGSIEWLPANERQPEPHIPVIVYVRAAILNDGQTLAADYVDVGCWTGETWWTRATECRLHVSHWSPISIPKE